MGEDEKDVASLQVPGHKGCYKSSSYDDTRTFGKQMEGVRGCDGITPSKKHMNAVRHIGSTSRHSHPSVGAVVIA